MELKKFDEVAARFEKLAWGGQRRRPVLHGTAHRDGHGRAEGHGESAHWVRQSAEQGYVEAEAVLGFHYMQYGFGVKEDRAKAHVLYRQAAALGNGKAREALATFDRFSFPDRQSAAIYDQRVTSYMSAINGCQAQANLTGQTVTCLVPIIDWNPKAWQDC